MNNTLTNEGLTMDILKKELYQLLQENPGACDMDYFQQSKRSYKEVKSLFEGKNPLMEINNILEQIKRRIQEIEEYGGMAQVENDLKWLRIQYKLHGYSLEGYRGIDWNTYGKLDKMDIEEMNKLEKLYNLQF
jgi:hypothetical protein